MNICFAIQSIYHRAYQCYLRLSLNGRSGLHWIQLTWILILASRTLPCIWTLYAKHLFQKHVTERVKLLDLPTEILHEILKYLNCKELLSIRMICRTMCSITKSRHLWRVLAREIQALPGASPTEEPLDAYSDLELEGWVIRRCRIQYLWKNPEHIKVRKRILEIRFSTAQLLPGGRWVLGLDKCGQVYAVDLEDLHPIPQLLIDAGTINEQAGFDNDDSLDVLSLWEDPDRSRLSLRVVLYKYYNNPGKEHCFYFYEVQSQRHGSGATLVARLINTLRRRFRPRLAIAVALRKEYMVIAQVQATFTSDDHPHLLSICKYAPGNENDEPLITNVMCQDIESAHILCGSLVIVGTVAMNIFSLEQILHGDIEMHRPLHRIPLHKREVFRPMPIPSIDGKPRLTCISPSSVRGLSFPQDFTDSSAEITTLGVLPHNEIRPRTSLDEFIPNRPPYTIPLPGHSHSIVIVERYQTVTAIDIISHSPYPKSGGFGRHRIHLPYEFELVWFTSQSIGLCEDLGRGVLIGSFLPDDYFREDGDTLMIIDLL